LHRVTVRTVPDEDLPRPAVAIWSRLVVTGGGHHRLHEELTLSGGELEHQAFRRITQVGRLETLVDKAESVELGDTVFAVLKERFERHEEAVRAAVETRSRERLRYLQNTLTRRKEIEIGDLMTVLDDLEKSIRKELADESLPKQLTLPGMSSEETNQIRRDIASLQARLSVSLTRKRRERVAIESRYTDPTDRTFPVAVVFLMPHALRVNRKMDWQEYQEAVALLYEQMEGIGKVRRNVFLPDLITGQRRQVDVVIELNERGHSLSMLIDAKFHSTPLDVKDIEEVVSLSRAVGVNKTIVVAANGFTSPRWRRPDSLNAT
jgi:hypothetical protein